MTWVDVTARARGLTTRLAGDDVLAALAAAPDRARLAAAGYPGRDPVAVERAARDRAADDLAILARWAGDRASALAPLVDDEDRQALRAILRGLVAGAPAERRLDAATPTPRLPAAALRALAEAPTAPAIAAALARRAHPFAAALAAPLAAAPLDLVAAEVALAGAFAARARVARDPAIVAYVAQAIDGDHVTAALLLAARGGELDPAACFHDGGARLDRPTFLAVIAPTTAARRRLAAAFARTPLAAPIAAGAVDAIEPATLAWQLATQARRRRHGDDDLAEVVWMVLRRRRERSIVRRAAWRLALEARP